MTELTDSFVSLLDMVEPEGRYIESLSRVEMDDEGVQGEVAGCRVSLVNIQPGYLTILHLLPDTSGILLRQIVGSGHGLTTRENELVS